jgi:hypothetical protein
MYIILQSSLTVGKLTNGGNPGKNIVSRISYFESPVGSTLVSGITRILFGIVISVFEVRKR